MASETQTSSAAANTAKFGGIMVFSMLLSRILGLLRDTVMTTQFGIGLDADSYRIAVQIPDTLFMLIAGGGLSSAFIPVFSEFWHKDRRAEAWKLFSVVVTLCSIIVVVLIVGAWFASPAIVHFFQGKKPDSVLPAALAMSRIMLPAQFAFLVGSILLATLYVRKDFLAPGLAPNVYNVGIIAGTALLPGLLGLGIESMAWGALIGALVGNLFIPAIAMTRAGSSFKPSLDFESPGVRQFFVLLLPVILGFSLPSMVNLITQKFASNYRNDGINTVLALSNNLMQAPLGIFGQALAMAAFPVLAEFVATNRMDRYRDQVSRTLRTVLYLGIPSAALMMALSPQIIHVLYGYGKAAKSPEQLAATADCLRIYCFGIFAWCLQPVLMRGFFSLQRTFKPIAIGTVMTLAFILLCIGAQTVSGDFRLLPWATNIAATLLAIVLFFALELEVGKLDRVGIVQTAGKSFLAAGIAGSIVFAASHALGAKSKLLDAALLFFVGLAGAWIYFFITRALKMPETEYVAKAMNRLERRRGRGKVSSDVENEGVQDDE